MRAHPQQAGATEKLELAQVLDRHGAAFRARHALSPVQRHAMRAIETCRSSALGGHLEQCDACGTQRYLYHSCRNRHCPKCQTRAKERWLAGRQAELLPVPYYHVVFTLPHTLNALAQGNPRIMLGLLFDSAARTLLEFGENPRWLGGQIGLTMVLHTWGQNLNQHLHLHCLVSGGALAQDGRWMHPRRGFLFPVKALSMVFRGKFLEGLKRAFEHASLKLAGGTATLADMRGRNGLFAALRAQPWVVYAKRPFAGPAQVLQYLGRYTHRVALTNNRLVNLDEHEVAFRYKDYAHGNRRCVMHLPADEFIRRFLLHVLPKGFMRIRHYGLLGNRGKRHKLSAARCALEAPVPPPSAQAAESVAAFWQRVSGIDIHRCPRCRTGHMLLVRMLAPLAHGPPQ
jgi:hypothetical protein